jgi:hypothetical protein
LYRDVKGPEIVRIVSIINTKEEVFCIFWEVDAKDFTFMSRPFERTTEKVRYALFEFHLACYDFPSRVDYDYVGCKE